MHEPRRQTPMPYIVKEKRAVLDPAIQRLADSFMELDDEGNFAGNLNYVITRLLGILYPDPNYRRFNDMVGALECCKLELYRKKIAPYEDIKEQENGPV
jgi:hypothetical protein